MADSCVRYHVGRKSHVTIWRGESYDERDIFVGAAQTPEMAAEIVSALNRAATWSDYAASDAGQLEYATQEIATLKAENAKLRDSIRNQLGDGLCWLIDSDVPEPEALTEGEFLESCRRYRNQIAGERGEAAGCMTIAQLEARIAELEAERGEVLNALRQINSMTEISGYDSGHTAVALISREWIDRLSVQKE